MLSKNMMNRIFEAGTLAGEEEEVLEGLPCKRYEIKQLWHAGNSGHTFETLVATVVARSKKEAMEVAGYDPVIWRHSNIFPKELDNETETQQEPRILKRYKNAV